MKAYLRAGLAPGSAMRSTWADVKRGQVAPPPRRARRNERPSSRELVHVDVISGRGATHNPRVRRLKHRGRVYDVLGRDPGLIPHTLPGYLVRRPKEKAVQLARVSPGRVEYVVGVAQSTRQLGRPYREAIRRYTRGNQPPPDRGVCLYCQRRVGIFPGPEHSESCPRYRAPERRVRRTIGRRPPRRTNPRITLARVGQLVALAVRGSGADLDSVSDAHAQVYGYPRGDVYEMARRWLERESLRNPAPRYFKRPGGVRLDVIGRDPRAPGVFTAVRSDDPEGMVYAVRSARGRMVSVSPVTRSRRTLRGEYQRGPRRNRGFFRAIGRGVKRGYHKYRASRYEEKARAQRRKAASYNPPAGGVLIYDRVLKVFAQKGRGPHRGQRFVHHFRSAPRMVGLPNGDLLITGK